MMQEVDAAVAVSFGLDKILFSGEETGASETRGQG